MTNIQVPIPEPQGFRPEDRKALYRAEFEIENIKLAIIELKETILRISDEKADKDQLSTEVIKDQERRIRNLENWRNYMLGGFAVVEVLLKIFKIN